MSNEEKEDSFAPLIIVTLFVIAFIAIMYIGYTGVYIVTVAKDVLKSRYKNKEDTDSEQKHLMESINDE